MNYIELQLTLDPDFADILTAELAEIGFESFVETDAGVNAYIPEPDFARTDVDDIVAKYAGQTAIAYQFDTLEKRNWNAEWERDYQPIEVAAGPDATGLVRVRASFHEPDPRFRHDLIINPKMSFGTGHHETTAMMLEQQLRIDHAGKVVLDVGSGTGILAILAAKLGARAVLAFDIEEWAVENARENAVLNECPQVQVFQGTIDNITQPDETLDRTWFDQTPPVFDIILANINRNVLLAEIPVYTSLLKEGGSLVISGFYEADAPDIQQKAAESQLTFTVGMAHNQWTSLAFTKPTWDAGSVISTLFATGAL